MRHTKSFANLAGTMTDEWEKAPRSPPGRRAASTRVAVAVGETTLNPFQHAVGLRDRGLDRDIMSR